MSTWIEYISAFAVASFVAVTLFTVQFRSQEVSIDSTQYRSVKTAAVNVIEMIESDMKNLGGQHPSNSALTTFGLPGGAAFGIQSAPDTTNVPHTFRFYAPRQRGAAPSVIRYEWAVEDSIQLSDGTQRPLYTFRRIVDGSVDGESNGILTKLTFNLLESPGNAITNLDQTEQVFVEVRAISPLGRSRTVGETRWSSTFRPRALTIHR